MLVALTLDRSEPRICISWLGIVDIHQWFITGQRLCRWPINEPTLVILAVPVVRPCPWGRSNLKIWTALEMITVIHSPETTQFLKYYSDKLLYRDGDTRNARLCCREFVTSSPPTIQGSPRDVWIIPTQIHKVQILLYKLWRPKGSIQFEIIINVSVSSFRFIWIPMLWFYGHYIYFNSFSGGINFRRQNLTSIDVRFWHLNLIPAL